MKPDPVLLYPRRPPTVRARFWIALAAALIARAVTL